jgi:hypothetical protein
MRTRLSLLILSILVFSFIPSISFSSSPNLEIQAITDSNSGEVRLTFNSKIARASVRSYQITATPNTPNAASYSKTFTKKVSGYVLQRIPALTPGIDYKFRVSIRTTKNRVINSAYFNFYTRSIKPTTPLITRAFETDSDEAVVYFDAPANDGGTPVLYYTAKANPGNATGTTLQQGSGSITITGLTKSTTYTFTVIAHNINGASIESKPSLPVTTLANKIIRVAPASSGPTLAAPAFTISASAETKTVGILATGYGYSITSTGGTIASYSISPALPAGLTLSPSDGLITGRATETRTATTHIITATNAAGSASASYRLRVTGDIGDIGPGGGRIFYYLAAGFNCGASFTDTGSPTGEKCKYLEAAPSLWNGGDSDPRPKWAQTVTSTVASPDTATATGTGWGYRNTRAIVSQGNTDPLTSAAALADSHTFTFSGVVYADWYLPSQHELNQMCKWARGISDTNVTTVCTGGTINTELGFAESTYWSSTEYAPLGANAWFQRFSTGAGLQQDWTSKTASAGVRPIRAF